MCIAIIWHLPLSLATRSTLSKSPRISTCPSLIPASPSFSVLPFRPGHSHLLAVTSQGSHSRYNCFHWFYLLLPHSIVYHHHFQCYFPSFSSSANSIPFPHPPSQAHNRNVILLSLLAVFPHPFLPSSLQTQLISWPKENPWWTIKKCRNDWCAWAQPGALWSCACLTRWHCRIAWQRLPRALIERGSRKALPVAGQHPVGSTKGPGWSLSSLNIFSAQIEVCLGAGSRFLSCQTEIWKRNFQKVFEL